MVKATEIRFVTKFIGSNPNCSRADIASGTHFSPVKVGEILELLREKGDIKMEGVRKGARYTAISLREKILKAVRFHAGATRAFLAEKLDEKPEIVGYHLAKMKESGELTVLGSTRNARYYHSRYHHRCAEVVNHFALAD